ncbi:MAG: HAMP domain-containing sensor histidine kinase [Arcobacteraceae bacterium]
MASMGEMIGNIAHQWRQPLSVISVGATGMKMQKELNILTDKQFEETCDAINKNAQYLSKTIDDFKNFIKNDRDKIKFNLKENVESFLSLVNSSITHHQLKIVLDLDETIILNSYPNELTQCFMNLFSNAKDALSNIQGEKYLFISTKINGTEITISFKDNAGGIDSKVIEKIFEPYFTTKHKSQGTGLGLSMTYKIIVEGMDGVITVHNSEYEYNHQKLKGAEFLIKLHL